MSRPSKRSDAGEIGVLAPIQSTSATRTATAATARTYALAYQLPKKNPGRAPCEAATGLPGPRIEVTNWPTQRRSHSGTLVGTSAPRGVPRSPAGNQHATTAPAQHSQAAYPAPPAAKINIPTAINSCPTATGLAYREPAVMPAASARLSSWPLAISRSSAIDSAGLRFPAAYRIAVSCKAS